MNTAEKSIKVQRHTTGQAVTESALRAIFHSEGLRPYRWSNGPSDVYDWHSHTNHKVLYVVEGSITFGVADAQQVTLRMGDRLELSPGVQHNAVVGPEGVVCLEARRES